MKELKLERSGAAEKVQVIHLPTRLPGCTAGRAHWVALPHRLRGGREDQQAALLVS